MFVNILKYLAVGIPITAALYWLLTLSARRLLLKPGQLRVASVLAATVFVLITVLYPPINNLSVFIIAVKWSFFGAAIYCWRRSKQVSTQPGLQQ
jgi:hypothetical protein